MAIVNKVIPEAAQDWAIYNITIDIGAKTADIPVHKSGYVEHVNVDLVSAISGLDADEIAAVRKFIKVILAEAWEITVGETPDTL